jgi:hypothetical protein
MGLTTLFSLSARTRSFDKVESMIIEIPMTKQQCPDAPSAEWKEGTVDAERPGPRRIEILVLLTPESPRYWGWCSIDLPFQ